MIEIQAIETLIALSLLGVLTYGPWQWACADLARQRMFKNRDELFDMARRGELDFRSDSYRNIRMEMNNMIRFAHGLTWVRLALLAVAIRNGKTAPAPIYASIKDIGNIAVRNRVRALVADSERAAVLMILYRSPVLIILSIVTIIPALLCFVAYLCAKQVLGELAREVGGVIQAESSIWGQRSLPN